MSLAIAGMGWITPLGNGVDPVWQRLLEGAEAPAEKIREQLGDQSYSVFRACAAPVQFRALPRSRVWRRCTLQE